MRRLGNSIGLLAALGALVWLGSCGDDRRDPAGPDGPLVEPAPPAFQVIVSNPVPAPTAAAPGDGSGPATTGDEQSLVYVSMAPGTHPAGETIRITNLATDFARTDSLVDGGLDPVRVPAAAGDTLELVVTDTAGATERVVETVTELRSPIVVRTDPPPQKTDVPLNANIIIVFSEPIDPATLTESSVQLLLRTTPITGRREFRDPDNLTAVFVPDVPLAASTEYTLVVTQGIRDLSGQPLEASVTVHFTTAPPLVSGGLPFVSVSAGHVHTCGVTAGGEVHCWGVQLIDPGLTTQTPPTLVSGDLAFSSVSTGAFYTCGVTTGGPAYCWGLNGYGQLGDGTLTDRSAPALLVGGLTFASVRASATHTCGVTTDGQAYCWGWNYTGQLGDGTRTDRSVPGPVSGGLVFTSVSAGPFHTCGVTTGGEAYCWGGGGDGQLGNGTMTDSPVPVAVSGGLVVTSVTAGVLHTCALTTAGQAYCWGRNTYGQLGDGTFTDAAVPVLVAGGLEFASLSAESGGDHTCGLTPDGQAYCWGRNDTGQIGDGTLANQAAPVPVSGGHAFVSVSAGGGHTCGVTTAGQLYCWGRNDVGQGGPYR